MTTPAAVLDSIVGPAPEGCLASARGRDSVSAGAAPPLGRVKRTRESGRSQATRNEAALAVTAQSAISLDFMSARRSVGVVMRTADCYNATRAAAYLANIHVSRRLAIDCSRRSSTARKEQPVASTTANRHSHLRTYRAVSVGPYRLSHSVGGGHTTTCTPSPTPPSPAASRHPPNADTAHGQLRRAAR